MRRKGRNRLFNENEVSVEVPLIRKTVNLIPLLPNAFRVIFSILMLSAAPLAVAAEAMPTSDKPGSRDATFLPRYQGSFIVSYEHKGFDEFTVPLSRLEPIPGKLDKSFILAHEPKKKKTLEGPYTRLVYLIPQHRSPLEVLRNYQDEIQRKGGNIVYECKADACGGSSKLSTHGAAEPMSLSMYLYSRDRVKDAYGTIGYCALSEKITDQRYAVAEISGTAHASVLTYTLVAPGDPCKALNDRTIAVIDIVETQGREQKMVTVRSDEMATAIASTGRIALYGIYFDFNKADIRPESDATLEQIGKLLKTTAALKLLVVGHTDNIGSFVSNMELSQRRAAAVVNALTVRFGVGRDRLMPVGVSCASPVASNETENGRAKNRRVELAAQ
jgi:OOP family OmpA-OmpF porin